MDLEWRAFINTVLITIFGSGLTMIATYFWHQKNKTIKEVERLADERAKLAARVADVERQLSLVSQTVTPINAAMQALLIKELTHFHTPVMDALMVKLGPPPVITPEEEVELLRLLAERATELNGTIPDLEKDAAVMLPLIMKRVRNELESTEPVAIQTVAVPAIVVEAP